MDRNVEAMETSRSTASDWSSWFSNSTKHLATTVQNEMMKASEDAKLFCNIILEDSKTWINRESMDSSVQKQNSIGADGDTRSHNNVYEALWASEVTYLCDPPQMTSFLNIRKESNHTTEATIAEYDKERRKEYDSNHTVQAMYKILVPKKVSDHDFWTRLFSRMDQLNNSLNNSNAPENEPTEETECDEYDISWT